MRFNIQPYAKIVGEDDGMPFICTPSGVTRLHDHSMIDVLTHLKALGVSTNQPAIDQLFADQNIDPRAGRSFLERINILKRYRDDVRVVVYSTDGAMAVMVAAQIERNDAVDVVIIDELGDISGPTILICVQAQYDHGLARAIVDLCHHKPDLFLLHAYFVLRHFVIDGFYSVRMALPDHFSSLYNLAGLDRSSKFKPSSWADVFFAHASAVSTTTVPTLPRSSLEESAALHLLYTRFRQLIASEMVPVFSDDLGTVTEMNLDSGHIQRHRANHSSFSSSMRDWAVSPPSPMGRADHEN
ncbi:McbB family protein [uncultured Phyllobacterium sp.]|uniref:McbB family protein n=1 Tax=uncultured Phyllobacterium sp. TaxID=253813 RepID=UPI00258422C9|nr:McbB family protein [uncultured Phyllobacterium sp.]